MFSFNLEKIFISWVNIIFVCQTRDSQYIDSRVFKGLVIKIIQLCYLYCLGGEKLATGAESAFRVPEPVVKVPPIQNDIPFQIYSDSIARPPPQQEPKKLPPKFGKYIWFFKYSCFFLKMITCLKKMFSL